MLSVTRTRNIAISIDRYSDQSEEDVVFAVFTIDEPDGSYGPDGRKALNSKRPEFIDTYV
jgi:hypothetical protein